MTPDTDPPFPRLPEDPENLKRLRAEAQRRLDEEQRPPAPVYGGPPSGGGSGGRPVTRRWTLAGLIVLVVGAIGALLARIFGWPPFSRPLYGGPPLPQPPMPVYGGPVAPPPCPGIVPPPQPQPQKPHKKHEQPAPPIRPNAPVYGGPPPQPPPPSN